MRRSEIGASEPTVSMQEHLRKPCRKMDELKEEEGTHRNREVPKQTGTREVAVALVKNDRQQGHVV